MAAQVWVKHVPASITPRTAIPLNYHLLLQENIPVKKGLITTIADEAGFFLKKSAKLFFVQDL